MNKKYTVIPVFIPHKGCPYDCIFCNQKNISGQKEDITFETMRKTIEDYLKWSVANSYLEIAFYGGSFTGIKKEEQISFLKVANEYIRNGCVNGIRLSTRPDYIDKEILSYLKYYNVTCIELGVQSLDDEVLIQSSRGHTVEDVYRACELIKSEGFSLGIQTMIGLPGDSPQKNISTCKRVVEIGPHIVRIYPTLVIRNTYLEKMYNDGLYKPLELDEAVDILSELLPIYYENNINVIRVGLQPTDTINEGMDVLAGPFHPALRQLAESKLALKNIEKQLEEKNLFGKNTIVIATEGRKISDVVGQKRENIRYLREKYKFQKIFVKNSDNGCELYDIKY